MKYLIIGLTIFLMSCAALGSRTTVHNNTKIGNIKTVGLITKRFDQSRNLYHKMIKESFTRTLVEEIEKKGLFKIVVLDTMENEKLNIKSYVTDATVDAILVADWKLVNPHNMASDSKVQLSLVDKDTKEILLISSHGSLFGNSYWMPQPLPRTLIDATVGAVNTMAKNLKSKR